MGGGVFGFFLDLVFLLPLILAVRAVWPTALAFRIACIGAGLYLVYGYAPRFVPFVIGYWLLVWALQRVAEAADRTSSRLASSLLLTATVVVPLAPMLIWKLAPSMFVDATNEAAARVLWAAFPFVGFVDALVAFVVPLGLSFATFRAIDLLLKVHLGFFERLSFDRVLYYGLFPPILALGPIAEYEEVRADERPASRAPQPSDLAVGTFRIGFGAIKVFLIGQGLERAAAWAWGAGAAPIPSLWLAVLLYGLFFYANFSGYSDVAIGSARVLGLRLKENFNNPFLKTNPQAFWNAWHMSLTRWAQRYVFLPLGGARPERQYFAIFMTILVIALWHGLEAPMIVFGIYHAAIVVAHRWLEDRRRKAGVKATPDIVWIWAAKCFGVLAYVSLSIPLLILDSEQAISFYGRLFFGLAM